MPCEHASSKSSFPDHWVDGLDPTEPALQVHRYAEGTWIMRQSLLDHWEAPFIYLFAGSERAILFDTGAPGKLPLRQTVDQLVGGDFPLIVAHTHSHFDHLAGDWQFEDRENAKIVRHTPEEVAAFFGMTPWPVTPATVDLGGRIIDLIPIPGHDVAGIATYDRATAILVTNDFLYPGRLYVRDFPGYRASLERMIEFTGSRPVSWVLGCHIEMTTAPGVDYEQSAPTHPDEHPLELGIEHLRELWEAVRDMGLEPRREVHDDFIIVPRPA